MKRIDNHRRQLVTVPLIAVVVITLATVGDPRAVDSQDHDHDHDQGARASAGGAPFCGEHRVAEAVCGICHPESAADLSIGEALQVRLASPRSAALAGVRVAGPELRASAGVIQAHAELAYDGNRLAWISPRVDGVVRRVLVDVGDRVSAGQPLVEIASVAVADAKQTFVAARLEADLRRQDADRERRLREQGISAERELQAAEAAAARSAAAAAAAEQQLANLGLDAAAIASVAATGDASSRLVVVAPFAGEVIARDAAAGEVAGHDRPLVRLADLSQMWLEISVPASAVADLTTGLAVTARFDALPDREVAGVLTWISSGLDERTRLLSARATVGNPDGRLKAGLFGPVEIRLAGDGASQLTVPTSAVQQLDRREFVFVRQDADLFALRRVELGARRGDRVAVVAGLGAADSVVVAGIQVVATELLKSRLGAGCAGD